MSNITQEQIEELKRLSNELNGGAFCHLEALLILLRQEIERQEREAPCETSETIILALNYDDFSFTASVENLNMLGKARDITDENFNAPGMRKSFEHGTDVRRTFKIYRPRRDVSPIWVIGEMKKEGYRPATALETLEFYRLYVVRYASSFSGFSLFALGTEWKKKVMWLNFYQGLSEALLGDTDNLSERCEFLAVLESETV